MRRARALTGAEHETAQSDLVARFEQALGERRAPEQMPEMSVPPPEGWEDFAQPHETSRPAPPKAKAFRAALGWASGGLICLGLRAVFPDYCIGAWAEPCAEMRIYLLIAGIAALAWAILHLVCLWYDLQRYRLNQSEVASPGAVQGRGTPNDGERSDR